MSSLAPAAARALNAPRVLLASVLACVAVAAALPAGAGAASWTDSHRIKASWTDSRSPGASWTDSHRPGASWTDRAAKSRRH